MIFAAGYGSRLAPLTDHTPKPLIPLLNRPILFRTLAMLQARGVRRFVINAHHLGDQIKAALAEPATHRLGDVQVVREPVLLGTGGGLLNARPLLGEDDVLVVNGDIWFDLDLEALTRAHRRHDALATLLVIRRRTREDLHRVVYDPARGSILAFDGQPREGARRGIFTGVQIVSHELLERLPFPPGQPACVVHAGYRGLLQTGRIRACPGRGDWADLGTPADLLATTRLLLRRGQPRRDDAHLDEPAPGVWVTAGASVDPAAELVPPVLVGPDARVGAGARIGPYVVLGAGAQVAAGARVRDALLLPGARADGSIRKRVIDVDPASATPRVEQGARLE